jgi:hypothetical protein
MAFLRFTALLALAFWIGGLSAIGGLTATALFEVLEARDPAGGREMAAVAFAEVFGRFQQAAWVAGAVVIASLVARAALGPRPKRFGLRVWVSAGMLAASVSSVLVVAPAIERARAAIAGPVASLAADDPQRVAFGRWHALSAGLMALTIAAGAGLIWSESTDRY